VDDYADAGESLAMALRDDGFDVDVTRDGGAAWPQHQHIDARNRRHADDVAGDVVPGERRPQQPADDQDVLVARRDAGRLERLDGQAQRQGQGLDQTAGRRARSRASAR
jgi:hypothetical protein